MARVIMRPRLRLVNARGWRQLDETGWQVQGADGPAELLGVKPNTLLAGMKNIGLRRPD